MSNNDNDIRIIPASDTWAVITPDDESTPYLLPVIGWAVTPSDIGGGNAVLGTRAGFTQLASEYCNDAEVTIWIGTYAEAEGYVFRYDRGMEI